MYYKINKDCYFRSYGDIGYITSTGLYNDRVVDRAGAIFLSALSKQPRSLDVISSTIKASYPDADISEIQKDATEFFDEYVEDGFLSTGTTAEETELNDKGFTYNAIDPITIKTDFSPKISRAERDTQSALEEHFAKYPSITSFQIELTSRCNERCIHCYIPHELKSGDMSDEMYYDLLDQLSDLGAWQITLSGGEPMLHPHFADFVRAAKQKDFHITVLSNLTRVSDEIVEVLASDNPCAVQVSLYSLIPKHHDLITQLPGSFDKTTNAILKLIEHDVPVQISCPTMQINKDDFADILKWAHDHKIRAITDYSIMAEYNHDTSNLVHRLDPNQCGEVILDTIEWDADYQAELLADDFPALIANFPNDPEGQLCGIGVSTCCIVANGNVYPCAGWQEYICGNVAESSLKEIWYESEQIKHLRSLRRKELKACMSCDSVAFCSPCLVRNANESPTGDPFEINPYFCEVAKVNKDIVMKWREEHLSK